jgi:hypothetical protein
MPKIRGSNPVWANFDLQGLIFDDSFYLWVLQNEFPYLPSDQVFFDVNGDTPASIPIQYRANGTLPDVFFTPGFIYRLEFRKNDGTCPVSQDDALIYLIENYRPEGSGPGPTPGLSINSDNLITNPQFPLVSFESPTTFTAIEDETLNIAPGWDVVVVGTGNLTLTQQALTSADEVPTNAPYGLLVQTTGFTSAYLRQRFNENGTIWSSAAVAVSITAKNNDGIAHVMNVTLVNNAPTPQEVPIGSNTLTTAWQEFVDADDVPDSTNTAVPPDAWTELRISLPQTGSVGITSIQLMGQDTPAAVGFEQEPVARQIDHTFNVYRDSILFQPKDSLLTGANYSLNPWQTHTTASATLTANTAYTADQTIIHQKTGVSKIAVGRGGASSNHALNVTAVTNDNRFAVIEYIDPSTIRPYWGQRLSALLRARLVTTHGTNVRVKMRLITRASLPPAISSTQPIASWATGQDPVFAAGWVQHLPENDPAYTLGSSYQNFNFDKMAIGGSTNENMTLGLVIYTVDNMNSAATADIIQFERCSLVPNDFAIDANVLTFDDNLRRCQFYYEKSYPLATIPGVTTTQNGTLLFTQPARHTGGLISHDTAYRFQFQIDYAPKRATPTIILRSPSDTTANEVQMAIMRGTSAVAAVGANPVNLASAGWTLADASFTRAIYQANNTGIVISGSGTSNEADQQEIRLQFEANARLGK